MSDYRVFNSWTLPAPPGRRDVLIGFALFVVTFMLMWCAPVTTVCDSKYELLLTQNLLTRGSFVLDGYDIPHKPVVDDGTSHLNGDIYQIEIVDGHFYYYFPPGSSILSAPFVLLTNALGQSVISANHAYTERREEKAQHLIASLLMAGLTVTFYLTARLALSTGWSLVIALGGVLGTQVWSTASRALWTHTWGIALLGFAILLLFAYETGRRRLPPVLLATVLSWTYFVRPTNSVFIVAFTVYVLLCHRRAFPAYAATGAAWFAAFVGYSWYHFHHLLPSYYQANRLSTSQFREALPGNLVSPSRGLLVFVPVVLFVFYLLLRYWRHQPARGLAAMAVAVCGAHLLVVSCFVPWHGGGCFGPRYTTELVPWFVLLAVLGVRAALDRQADYGLGRRDAAWRPGLAVGAALLCVSVAINARGACSLSPMRWNLFPVDVDEKPSRVWDWRYPQTLAGIVGRPLPAECPPLVAGQRVSFARDSGKVYLFDGWTSNLDPDFCWTEEKWATVIFDTEDTDASELRLDFGCYINGRKVPRQRVSIELNDRKIADLVVNRSGHREHVFPLPPGALQRRNLVTIYLPDATAPKDVSANQEDERTLGMSLYSLELESGRPGKE